MTTTVTVYDYHERAIEDRFLPLVRDQLMPVFNPTLRQIIPYVDTLDPPFVEILPSGNVGILTNGNVGDLQSYGEILRIVLGTTQSGYEGKLLRSLRKWVPTTINFTSQYRMLAFPSDDPATRRAPDRFDHLEFLGGNVTNPVEAQGQIGVDLNFNFVYSITIRPAPGNS